jgi:hypothetical protein
MITYCKSPVNPILNPIVNMMCKTCKNIQISVLDNETRHTAYVVCVSVLVKILQWLKLI